MDQRNAIRRDVDVKLDRRRTQFNRPAEARKGVLQMILRSATMSDTLDLRMARHGIYCRRAGLNRSAFRQDLNGRRHGSSTGERMTEGPRADDDREDLDLIARWKSGDQAAATRLVERHSSALARFAASSGIRDDVDELVQDTFVRAFNSLDGFRGESSFRTWLFTIERRLLLDRVRAEKRRRGRVEVQEGDAVTEFDALDGMVAGETEQRLRVAIERLSPTQRQVFALRVAEGMSYRDIADAVGTTEGAARVHYHNAMRSVKEFLDD